MKILISENQLKFLTESNEYYIYFGGEKKFIPHKISLLLDKAQTPEEIEQIISDNESKIAQSTNRSLGPYLDCDHTMDLMHQVLKSKGIKHQLMLGTDDSNIQSYSYVKIGNKRYDPTKQGFGHAKKEEVIWPSKKYPGITESNEQNVFLHDYFLRVAKIHTPKIIENK